MTQTITSSTEVLNSFSYISQQAAQLLKSIGATINGSGHSLHVAFPEGTQFEKSGKTYAFTMPCGCVLHYKAEALMGSNWTSRTSLILFVETFCSSHDGLTEADRQRGLRMSDRCQTWKEE